MTILSMTDEERDEWLDEANDARQLRCPECGSPPAECPICGPVVPLHPCPHDRGRPGECFTCKVAFELPEPLTLDDAPRWKAMNGKRVGYGRTAEEAKERASYEPEES